VLCPEAGQRLLPESCGCFELLIEVMLQALLLLHPRCQLADCLLLCRAGLRRAGLCRAARFVCGTARLLCLRGAAPSVSECDLLLGCGLHQHSVARCGDGGLLLLR